jgi:MFS family permease
MQVGLLASVPLFVASVLQLYTSKIRGCFKSRKKMITDFVLLQALMWIPLILIPILGFMRDVPLFILFVTIYFALGQFVNPVWNSLMGDLVDENTRGRFFGMRNRITGAVAFISLFTAGFFLSTFQKENILPGFAIIFSVALIARLVSWHYLGKTDDPPVESDKTTEFTFLQYFRKLKDTNYGKFALYIGFMNFSVSVAAPFFTVYMLRDLKLSYLDYTILTAAVALASFLAMTYWGRIADKFGNKRVLNVCGILVIIVPLLWLFSRDIPYLVFAQAVSGFACAGFTLSSGNFIYDNVKPVNRTRIFSYHNVLVGTSIFLGAVLGGVLSKVIATPWIFHSNLQILFLISGIMRAATSTLFLPKIMEVREVERITTKDLFLKYSGTGPILGLTYRTITGLHKKIKHIRKE